MTCPELPPTIVEEILLNLPGQQVVCVCRLVCTEWKSVVDSAACWRQRCHREGFRPLNKFSHKVPKDWQTFYFLCKKRWNPNANENLAGWDILQNGGNQWAVDRIFTSHPDENVTKCFVTSYGRCINGQLINLEEEGYSPAFMDDIQPNIMISDWCAPRWDCCGMYSMYEIWVELLSERKKPIKVFEPEPVSFQQWNDQQWKQITHTFRDYGPGVRFIHFQHGGKSIQLSVGLYGIRVTNSSVEIWPSG